MAEDSTLTSPSPDLTAPETGTQTDTTTAPDAPSKGFHELSKDERREFLETGKAPGAKASDGKTADSSTAPADGKKAAGTAAKDAPASEPGKPDASKKARNSEENRVNELLEDRKRERDRADRLQRDHDELKKRLDALEHSKPKADGTTDSSTTADPSEPKWKKYRAMKDAPKIADFDDPDDWGAAMSVFVAEQVAKEQAVSVVAERDRVSSEEAAVHQEMQRVIETAATRLEADEQAHPDLKAKVDPGLKSLLPTRMLPEGTPPTAANFAKDCIVFESDYPLQLHAFYSTPDGQAEWAQMMRLDRRGIERTIARRDLSFSAPATSGEAATANTQKAVSKTFTKTPPPPDKNGPKGNVVDDNAEAAVKTGDFGAFQRELDERDPGTRRRYGIRRG